MTFALYVLPLVALANVGALIWSFGVTDITQRLVLPVLLFPACLVALLPIGISALRMTIWCRFLRLPLGLCGALKVVTGTMLANSVTPSSTGSMPLKIIFLIREGLDLRQALTLSSLQTTEDTIAIFSLLGLCCGITGLAVLDFLLADPELYSSAIETTATLVQWALAALLFAFALGICVWIVSGWLGGKANGIVRNCWIAASAYCSQITNDWRTVSERGKGHACLNLGLALLQWSARFSVAGLVVAAFGTAWMPAVFWILHYLAQSISSLVPTPGGAGGAEGGFLLLFGSFVDGEILVAAMSIWSLTSFFLPLCVAALIFVVLQPGGKGTNSFIARTTTVDS